MDSEPDVLHALDRDLARAREDAARAMDRAEALSEQLSASLTGERERARLLALTDRAYKPPKKENTP